MSAWKLTDVWPRASDQISLSLRVFLYKMDDKSTYLTTYKANYYCDDDDDDDDDDVVLLLQIS